MPELGESPKHGELRDAVHIAVAPVVAGERLVRGERVRLDFRGRAFAARPDEAVGVVDPYLPGVIMEGEGFWLFMNPHTIQGLRHDWDHPAFPQAANLIAPWVSEKYMQDFADSLCIDLEQIKFLVNEHVASDGENAGVNMKVPPEFWEHYEVWTGHSVPRDLRRDFEHTPCCP